VCSIARSIESKYSQESYQSSLPLPDIAPPLTAYELIIRSQLALELVEVVQGLHGRKEEIGIDIAPNGLGR
jgi:hypothetical protein